MLNDVKHFNNVVGRPEITSLVMKTRHPKTRRPVHCVHCGNRMFFSYKKVDMIIEGAASPEEIEHEIRCDRCKGIFEIC